MTSEYPRPAVTVDIVVLTVIDADLKALLIKRGCEPFSGSWALPGGFVRVQNHPEDQGESIDAAASRELVEETNLPPDRVYLEQLYTFGAPGRDPRGRVITVAYFALVAADIAPMVRAGTDAAEAKWFSLKAEVADLDLAFDHEEILAKALARIRGKLDYTAVGFQMVPPTFTIAELRSVYEAVQGQTYDPGNFRRRFKRMQTDGILEQAPGRRHTGTKPASVYRFVRELSP